MVWLTFKWLHCCKHYWVKTQGNILVESSCLHGCTQWLKHYQAASVGVANIGVAMLGMAAGAVAAAETADAALLAGAIPGTSATYSTRQLCTDTAIWWFDTCELVPRNQI